MATKVYDATLGENVKAAAAKKNRIRPHQTVYNLLLNQETNSRNYATWIASCHERGNAKHTH